MYIVYVRYSKRLGENLKIKTLSNHWVYNNMVMENRIKYMDK